MLDSPGLTSATIAVRRDPPTVEEDLRSTTVPDDPVQRRDLILIERSREGDLDAFNAVWDAWVSPGNTPARATVEAKLASPDYVVEIMVVAAR